MIVIGILLGGLLASLALGEFAVRSNGWMLLQAIVGGFLLGYGSRLALGCNIGNFLSAWASAGLNAAAFTLGMVPGVLVGTKVVEKVFLRRARLLVRRPFAPPRGVRLLLLALSALLAGWLALSSDPRATLWFVFGLAFGAIGYVSRLCWATDLRWLVAPAWGTEKMIAAVGLAIATHSVGVWLLMYAAGVAMGLSLAKGLDQVQVLIGGFIFGVGMGIAGACIFSSEWRASSGSLYSVAVFLSTILLGMPVLAHHYEWWKSVLMQPLAEVSLYHLMGPLAILPVLAFSLFLIYAPALYKRLGRA